MIESAGQLASKLVIQSAVSPSVSESFSPSVSHSAGQLVSWSVGEPVSQSVSRKERGGGGEGWGSVTQLVGYSSGKVVSIGLPILLSISSGFFRNCQYP